MTITVDIRPEVQAALARQAAAQGRAVEAIAAALLEEAVHLPAAPAKDMPTAAPEPVPSAHRTGQAIIAAFEEIRGVLTDDEIDQMFTRNPSSARSVDLS